MIDGAPMFSQARLCVVAPGEALLSDSVFNTETSRHGGKTKLDSCIIHSMYDFREYSPGD